MARSSQTQQKRQRENKLREKAQLKRERRQQRQAEKKRTQQDGPPLGEALVSEQGADLYEPAFEPAGEMTGASTIDMQAVDQHPPQSAGIGASKLFVGNLPRGVADQELADFFTTLGFRVASAQVIRDRMTGEAKGFGFVELAGVANLQDAIERLNGQMLQDRRLTVSEARPQRAGFSGPRGGSTFGGRGR